MAGLLIETASVVGRFRGGSPLWWAIRLKRLTCALAMTAFTLGIGRENRYAVRALVVIVRPGSGVMGSIVQVPVRWKVVVGDGGLEPSTSAMSTLRSNQLS
jgi:hypothetical protein